MWHTPFLKSVKEYQKATANTGAIALVFSSGRVITNPSSLLTKGMAKEEIGKCI